MAELILAVGPAPGTPAADKVTIYAKTDNLIYAKDENGTETVLASSGLTQDQVLNRAAFRA